MTIVEEMLAWLQEINDFRFFFVLRFRNEHPFFNEDRFTLKEKLAFPEEKNKIGMLLKTCNIYIRKESI